MDKCRACLSSELELLFDLGPLPLAGGFLEPTDEATANEKSYPLPVCVCRDCGLVQVTYCIPQDTLFENYLFSSSTIQYLVNHFANYAKWIRELYNPDFVIEFGCNDGVLLQPLQQMGIKTCGVDISKNITALARSKGLNAITGYFDPDMAISIRNQIGRADIVTGSNAFPHNDNPGNILQAARELLTNDGHLILEMMYAGALLDKLQWDSMYHEHLSYFCLTTLDVLLKRYGFHPVHAEIVPMHAGSLRVVCSANPTECADNTVTEMLRNEYSNGYSNPVTWHRFAQSVKRQIEVCQSVMWDIVDSREDSIYAYGASGRATMWLNSCYINPQFVIDESPLRVGKLMPGVHTPIVGPEQFREYPPHYCIVTAWNYFEQIKAKHPDYNGIWVLPAPSLEFK